jgi:hypothetical protein
MFSTLEQDNFDESFFEEFFAEDDGYDSLTSNEFARP